MDKEPNDTLKDAELIGVIGSTLSGATSQYLLHEPHRVGNTSGQPGYDVADVFRFDHSAGEDLTSVTVSFFGPPRQPEYLNKGGVTGETFELDLTPLQGLSGDTLHYQIAYGSDGYGGDLDHAIDRITERAETDTFYDESLPDRVKPITDAIKLIFESDGVNRSGKQVADLVRNELSIFNSYDDTWGDITYWVDSAIATLGAWERPVYIADGGYVIQQPSPDTQTWSVDPTSKSGFFKLTGTHNYGSYIYGSLTQGYPKTVPIETGFQINLGTAIIDNKISMSTAAVRSEGSSGSFTNFTFTAKMAYAVGVPVTVNYVVKGTGNHAASAGDFVGGVLPSGKITFLPDQKTATFNIKVAADTVFEDDETFIVTLSNPNPSAHLVVGKASLTGTIVNDDISTKSSVSISPVTRTVLEGTNETTVLQFKLTLDKPAKAGETLTYYTKTSAGLSASDFSLDALPSGTIVFKGGEKSRIIEIKLAGDAVFEQDETVSVGIKNPSTQLKIGGNSIATITVVNDDPAPGDDLLDTAATSGIASPGTTVLGQMETAIDEDWFKTKLNSNSTYLIDATASNAKLPLDLYLSLRDNNGAKMVGNDNGSGDGFSPRIVFTPFESGNYYLGVQQYDFTKSSQYKLSVKNITESETAIKLTAVTTYSGNFFSGRGNDVIAGEGTIHGNSGNDTVTGGIYSDRLHGDKGNDIVHGGDGNDEIYGDGHYPFDTPPSTIQTGGDGIDRLYGEGGDDKIFGDGGNDFIDGGSGEDRLSGGKGDDTYVVDNLRDVVDELDYDGFGIDTVTTSSISINLGNANSVLGSVENATLSGSKSLTLTGNDLSNKLAGNSGNNSLSGRAGNDSITGGIGNDTILGEDGNDTLNGGQGSDRLDGGAGSDTASYAGDTNGVFASLTNSKLNTNDAKGDTYKSVENLAGSSFSDTLIGNGSANILNGALGNDLLVGGLGNDTFQFSSKLGSTNIDTIDDFTSNDDTIRLDDDFFGGIGKLGGLSEDAFHLGSLAADKEDRIIYESKSGKLFYDADGTGSQKAIEFALLDNALKITAADFFVVA